MKIEMLKTDDLIPYENNPRKNENAVDAVAESIKEFGFKVPIIIDKENVIIAGHTRLKAAQKLGLKEVPVIRADDLTDEQIKAFRLADNKTGEIAQWDFSLLDEELDLLKDVDMTKFGFAEMNSEYISDFFDRGVETAKKEEDESIIAYVVKIPEDREKEFTALLDSNGFEYSKK